MTSTNNRAVDHALEPFVEGDGDDVLPAALRLGNRDVTAEVTAAQLERAASWLSTHPPDPEALRRSRRALIALADEVKAALDPVQEAYKHQSRRIEAAERVERLPRIIAEAQRERDEASAVHRGPEAPADVFDTAHRLVGKALIAAERLVESVEQRVEADKPLTGKQQRRWNQLANKQLVEIATLSDEMLGGALAVPSLDRAELVEDDDRLDVLESVIDVLTDLEDQVSAAASSGTAAAEATARLEGLQEELARAEATLAQPLQEASGDRPVESVVEETAPLRARLGESARQFRLLWAREHRDELSTSLRRLADEARRRKSLRGILDRDPALRNALWSLFPAAGCTLLSLGNALAPEPRAAELTIVDEGGQCHPAYAVSALLRGRRTLVIGDTHQLEPVVQLDVAEEARVLRRLKWDEPPEWLSPYRVTDRRPASAQVLADRAVAERPVLLDHFRSQPEIVSISNGLCGYGLRVHTPPQSWSSRSEWLSQPVRFVPVRGQQVPSAGSWVNEEEAWETARAVQSVVHAGIAPADIAVLTPYRGQLDALRDRLRRLGLRVDAGLQNEVHDALSGAAAGPRGSQGVAVGTVHRFQGGERPVVFFSTVVTESRSMPFLNQRVNLVNVAVSRAQLHFICVGHPEVLSQGPVTRVLVAS